MSRPIKAGSIDDYRQRAKVRWPDVTGLYCYVRMEEYVKAFETGIFPLDAARRRQEEYKRATAEKWQALIAESTTPDPFAEEDPTTTNYLAEETQTVIFTPPTGFSHRKRSKTCQYCGASPVFWYTCPDGHYRLFYANGRPCSAQCHTRGREHSPTAEEVEEIVPDTPTENPHVTTQPAAPPENRPKTRAEMIAELLDAPQQLDEAQIVAICEKIVQRELSAENRVTVDVSVKIGELPSISCTDQHEMFPILLTVFAARIPLMLVGPAGSGKTTACHKAAEKLGLSFKFLPCGGQTGESRFIGYMDAKGDYVKTPLRESYESGGVFLFDEFDRSSPPVQVVMNAILANSCMTFPDGETVTRHPDFVPVAACNTFGQGADRSYVGAQQMDAATLDRFFLLEWLYDWPFVQTLAGIPTPRKSRQPEASGYTPHQWSSKVQAIEKYCRERNIRQIIGPRALLHGVKLLNCMPRQLLDDGLLWRGMNASQRQQIENAIGSN